jgi:hypothetical protein
VLIVCRKSAFNSKRVFVLPCARTTHVRELCHSRTIFGGSCFVPITWELIRASCDVFQCLWPFQVFMACVLFRCECVLLTMSISGTGWCSVAAHFDDAQATSYGRGRADESLAQCRYMSIFSLVDAVSPHGILETMSTLLCVRKSMHYSIAWSRRALLGILLTSLLEFTNCLGRAFLLICMSILEIFVFLFWYRWIRTNSLFLNRTYVG